MPKTLYVVSTPIGNLDDVSRRALSVLDGVSLVACEDTRTTAKLLNHYGIKTKTTAYHEHNEQRKAPALVAKLRSGEDIALVSDAGTPMVSDPGYRLVKAARAEGIAVRAIPGPSALTAALSVCGLPTSSFLFTGFLPPKGQKRTDAIDRIAMAPMTVVVFESPRRVSRMLSELAGREPHRPACLLRELTKLHEEHRDGTLAELAAWSEGQSFKGEITVVIGPREESAPTMTLDELEPLYRQKRAQGLSARAASKELSRASGLSSRDIYNAFKGD